MICAAVGDAAIAESTTSGNWISAPTGARTLSMTMNRCPTVTVSGVTRAPSCTGKGEAAGGGATGRDGAVTCNNASSRNEIIAGGPASLASGRI
jgi:hypothetical protein